jgi:hypothetical protein
MHPFHIDRRWFETYWYGALPASKRRSLPRMLSRLAVCVLIVIGGAAVVVEQAKVPVGSHQSDHGRVKFM